VEYLVDYINYVFACLIVNRQNFPSPGIVSIATSKMPYIDKKCYIQLSLPYVLLISLIILFYRKIIVSFTDLGIRSEVACCWYFRKSRTLVIL